jgi:hypothetical protein
LSCRRSLQRLEVTGKSEPRSFKWTRNVQSLQVEAIALRISPEQCESMSVSEAGFSFHIAH